MPLSAGTCLGPYELLHLLGSGGMGEVYAARDTTLGRLAALKVLPHVFSSDRDRLARFEREARLTSALNHPNIVTIYGVGRDGDVVYIAMELVEGETIAELARPLPIDRAIDITAQVAQALAKAHDAGVVHRDLKPQNVMVTRDGIVKLLDFGLSTAIPAGDLAETSTVTELPLTRAGVILGTVAYMSPEQAAGKPADFRSDQFSFGSLLYELLTGHRPFAGPTPVQTMAAIIDAQPRLMSDFHADVPAPLQAIVTRCLAKKPEDRYGSTRELVRDVEALRFRAAAAPPATARWKRHWTWMFATAAVVAALAVAAMRIGPLTWATASPPTREQLAVLPFAIVGGDSDSQSFGDGLVEVVTGQLTRIARSGGFDVVPASDIRSEHVSSPRDARRLFRVTRAVSGQIQRDGGSVRVTVNLVDTGASRQIDSRTIDMARQGPIAMQDAVAREVAQMLKAALPADVAETWRMGGTTKPAAYDAYLQGRGHLQRYDQIDAVDRAIAAFEQAVRIDDKYSLAHAGLAEASWRKYELTKDASWVARARASGATALGLSDRLAPVYLTLGVIDGGTGRYAEAIDDLQRVISLDPTNADAYRELANIYQRQGRTKETEASYKTAIDIQPAYWANYNALGAFYVARARYTDAERQFMRAIELAPDSTRARNNLGGLYIFMRRYQDAAAVLEKSAEIKPTFVAYNNLGTVYHYQGRFSDAARQMERAVALDQTNSQLLQGLASAYYWAPGERDKAAAAYARALAATDRERAINPRSAALLMRAADCHAMIGHADQARALAAEAIALAPEDVDVQFGAGVVYEEIGDRAAALALVTKALDHGYPRDLVNRSPELTELRKDARFGGTRTP